MNGTAEEGKVHYGVVAKTQRCLIAGQSEHKKLCKRLGDVAYICPENDIKRLKS